MSSESKEFGEVAAAVLIAVAKTVAFFYLGYQWYKVPSTPFENLAIFLLVFSNSGSSKS